VDGCRSASVVFGSIFVVCLTVHFCNYCLFDCFLFSLPVAALPPSNRPCRLEHVMDKASPPFFWSSRPTPYDATARWQRTLERTSLGLPGLSNSAGAMAADPRSAVLTSQKLFLFLLFRVIPNAEFPVAHQAILRTPLYKAMWFEQNTFAFPHLARPIIGGRAAKSPVTTTLR